jgi:uncharacterized protein YbjT (DUF2867 family)
MPAGHCEPARISGAVEFRAGHTSRQRRNEKGSRQEGIMGMRIAVAGATGRLGHHVVDVLEERGCLVTRIARAAGVDVISGTGLDDALAGAEVIVDAATGPSPDEQEATGFFTTAARNLQQAGVRAGVQRAVVASIIGTDKLTGGYGIAKVRHEDAWRSGPIPAVIVRAAQFHEFVEQLIAWGTRGGTATVPEMRSQIVAARTVAEVAADIAASPAFPAGEIVEVAGPRAEDIFELARLLVARRDLPVEVKGTRDTADHDAELQAAEGCSPARPPSSAVPPSTNGWAARSSRTRCPGTSAGRRRTENTAQAR